MFNLINILGQNTLPEQVEINKQNIAILADEVEKLGYQPKGVYDAETEYNHNDVVFYDNKLYVVTSDAAIVGVLPTNTTYWQQVTGDIRGQQGATGAQGEAGADGTNGVDGTDGVDALVCIAPYNSTNTAPTQGLIINGSALNFNRRPKLNDRFILIWNVTSTNSQYLCIMSVDTEGVIPMQCTVQYEYLLDGRPGEQGEQGETGEMALVYGQVIHRNQTLVENQDIVLTGLNMLVADFNRPPKADDQFVLLYFDTYAQKLYIGYAEVEGINGSTGAVTTVLYRDMHIVTGTNGINGIDGKDALVYSKIFEENYAAVTGDQLEVDISKFNRTPQLNEYFTAVYKATITSPSTRIRSFIVVMKYVDASSNLAEIMSFVETTGARTTLNKYTTTASAAKVYKIVKNAKGKVNGQLSCAIDGSYLSLPLLPSYDYNDENVIIAGSTCKGDGTVYVYNFFIIYSGIYGTPNVTKIAPDGTITALNSLSINTTQTCVEYYNDTEIT